MAKYNREKFMPLKAIMLEKGFTQKALAAKLKISEYALNMKLNGRSPISVDEAESISDILQIENPTEIFFARRLRGA